MPFQHDVRAVTVPGFVDGLIGLHDRLATLELEELLARRPPARRSRLSGVADARPTGRSRSPRISARPCSDSATACARAGGCGFSASPMSWRPSPVPVARASTKADVGRALVETRRRRVQPGGHVELSTPTGWRRSRSVRSAQAVDRAAELPGLSGAVERLDRRPGRPARRIRTMSAGRSCSSRRPGWPAFDRIDVLHEHADGRGLLAPERLGPRASALGEHASDGLADVYRERRHHVHLRGRSRPHRASR